PKPPCVHVRSARIHVLASGLHANVARDYGARTEQRVAQNRRGGSVLRCWASVGRRVRTGICQHESGPS
ncbi:hypothetical protein IWW52_005534, partial [Coemansia sp. RSA 2704]